MMHTEPTPSQALSFYRAALSAARLVDRDNDHRVLDADADAAWRAYGGDLPPAVRCDLVLRNFAMLYPAAFAPGPVFGLSGWYDDDPWGAGFERPSPETIASIFASRTPPASPADALDHVLSAWGLGPTPSPDRPTPKADPRLVARLSASTNVVVAGPRAVAHVVRAFLIGERLSPRTQVVLADQRPESRHILGVACALLREAGVPLLVDPRRGPEESAATWAERQKQRLGLARARLLVTSPDASPPDIDGAKALAAALGADDILEIAPA